MREIKPLEIDDVLLKEDGRVKVFTTRLNTFHCLGYIGNETETGKALIIAPCHIESIKDVIEGRKSVRDALFESGRTLVVYQLNDGSKAYLEEMPRQLEMFSYSIPEHDLYLENTL